MDSQSLAPASGRHIGENRRFCCATLYDAPFAYLGDLALSTLIQYARHHGFDLAHADSAPSDRPLPWHKILMIDELFRCGYECVFWMDADAILLDLQQDIRDILEAGKDFYLVRHRMDGRETPNTGVMLARNTPWTRSLLKQIWAQDQYIDHAWWENAALIHLLCGSEFADADIVNRGEPLSQEKIKWLDEAWNVLPRFSKTSRCHVKHFAGESPEIRRAGMEPANRRLLRLQQRVLYRFAPLRGASFPIRLLRPRWRRASNTPPPPRSSTKAA